MLLSRRQTILLNLCLRQTNIIIILISLFLVWQNWQRTPYSWTAHREAAKATVAQHLSLLKLISALHEVLKFGLRFKYREVRKNKRRFDCNQIRKDDSPFDRIVYLIHLELIDGSYRSLQMWKVKRKERRIEQEGRERDSKLSGSVH